MATQQKASTDHLQKAMTQQAAPPAQPDPYRTAQAYLKKLEPAMAEALPKSSGMTAERLSRITLTTLRQNPKLLECTIESLLGAVLQSAQLNLEPNLLGSCYFIPYNQKNSKPIVSFQIGFKGMIDLVTRRGEVISIVTKEVRKGDTFHYEWGRNETLKHIKAPHDQRGEIEYFYAYAHLKNGGFTFEVMHVSEIEKIRNEHSKAYQWDKQGSIWVKHYEAMAKKTVIKQLIKYLPISVETQDAIAHDETIRKDITADAMHVDYEAEDGTEGVPFEGEILDKEI